MFTPPRATWSVGLRVHTPTNYSWARQRWKQRAAAEPAPGGGGCGSSRAAVTAARYGGGGGSGSGGPIREFKGNVGNCACSIASLSDAMRVLDVSYMC